MSASKIPATIVTGFLGAGKTTLIRHVLENARDRRLALVINEFGDVGVDGDILRACSVENCPEENIVELANGCLCCTVADDFVPAIEALLAHEKRPDHIIIETSGLALPKPLVKAFETKQPIKTWGKIDTIANGLADPYTWDGKMCLKGLRESGGTAVDVDDDKILEMQRLIAKLEGVFAEPTGITSLAGAVRLLQNGTIDASDVVCVEVTGSGFKDMSILDKGYEKPPLISSISEIKGL